MAENKDEFKVLDWYFPGNDESRMQITVEINGCKFCGIIERVD